MLGGGLSDPPPPPPPSAPTNSASSTIHSGPSQSSSNRPPQPQERPPAPPRLNTQVPSASGPSTISPISQGSSGTADPRRRPSLANPTAGPEGNYDLTKIQAQLQDPNFVAALKTVVGTSNTGSQSPTIPMPPPAATTRGAPNQPPPQLPSQPSGPASAPPKSEPWCSTAAASKSWGRRSPQRRESQDWRSAGPSGWGDHWASRPGPSTDTSWTKVSSAAAPPSDAWAYGASGDWNAVAPTTAVWETRHTETPVYTWSIPAAPPPEKPDPDPRPATTAPLKTQPPTGPSSLRGNIDGHSAFSTAPLLTQHAPHETPANKEPPRKLDSLTFTTTSSVQPHQPGSASQKAIPPKPASVDEQPPSPDKLYDYSKSEDDPESTAWRAIIKELGSVYRDHVSYQELEKQRSELEALAERAAARSNSKPEANAGQGYTGLYSGKIKDLKQQMHSLSLSMEKKADEWAAASTVGQST
ncbi:hypothetical protein FRC00_012504, partial [Tulasnella sp. 408]